MKVTTEFTTGGGKGIEEVGEGHWRLEMRRDKQVYENYFHFRVESEGYEGEATLDVYPDQDFLPESRRILETHFSPATLWRSAEGPFAERIEGWRPPWINWWVWAKNSTSRIPPRPCLRLKPGPGRPGPA